MLQVEARQSKARQGKACSVSRFLSVSLSLSLSCAACESPFVSLGDGKKSTMSRKEIMASERAFDGI